MPPVWEALAAVLALPSMLIGLIMFVRSRLLFIQNQLPH